VNVALLLAAVLAIAAIVAVALPFIREPEVAEELDRLAGIDPAERRRLQLLEERDRALAALSELELDHRTGKVSDEDYAAQIGPLRARAAAALRALDSAARTAAQPEPAEPDDRVLQAVRVAPEMISAD
jgi:hypothetical protein